MDIQPRSPYTEPLSALASIAVSGADAQPNKPAVPLGLHMAWQEM